MGIQCEFRNVAYQHSELVYSCTIDGKQMHENRELELIGKHANGKTNNDVACVQFTNCTITKVPQGLTKKFPNLKDLIIYNSKLKQISKNDLVEYKNLEKFACVENDLEFVPGDLFEDFKNLNWISFRSNKLRVVEPNILDGLQNLKHVNFDKNPNYDKCYSVYSVYNPNATLEEVKEQFTEKFIMRFQFLLELTEKNRQLQNSKDTLGREAKQLKDEKSKINHELQLVKATDEKLKQEIQELKKSEAKLKLENEKIRNSKSTNQLSILTADIKSFIIDETTKDFRIQIDDREFSVHKFLLAARSSTLAEILRNNPEVENLNLVDISVEIFEKILKFLYNDELPCEDGTNFLHLFAAAGKLKIDELKNFAAQKLIDHIDDENALEVLNLSTKYEQNILKQKAFGEVKKKYPEIKFKDKWTSNSELLMKVVKMLIKKEEFDEQLKEIMAMK